MAMGGSPAKALSASRSQLTACHRARATRLRRAGGSAARQHLRCLPAHSYTSVCGAVSATCCTRDHAPRKCVLCTDRPWRLPLPHLAFCCVRQLCQGQVRPRACLCPRTEACRWQGRTASPCRRAAAAAGTPGRPPGRLGCRSAAGAPRAPGAAARPRAAGSLCAGTQGPCAADPWLERTYNSYREHTRDKPRSQPYTDMQETKPW